MVQDIELDQMLVQKVLYLLHKKYCEALSNDTKHLSYTRLIFSECDKWILYHTRPISAWDGFVHSANDSARMGFEQEVDDAIGLWRRWFWGSLRHFPAKSNSRRGLSGAMRIGKSFVVFAYRIK